MSFQAGEDMGYTAIGKITSTHGVKGDVRIYPLTDDPDRFFHLDKAFIGDMKEEVLPFEPRFHKGLILIRFVGLEDINQILKFKGEYLYVLDEDRVRLPEGRYFISDLVGCEVFKKSGDSLGIIQDVLQGAGNDVYVVDGGNGREYLIPAVERFVLSVDIVGKRILVDPIEGMIE